VTLTVSAFEPTLRALDELGGDLLILSAAAGEHPLRGLAGVVDWRLRGALSRWLSRGFATCTWGERVLYPTRGLLPQPRLLLAGLGASVDLRRDRALAVARAALEAAAALGAHNVVCDLFGLELLPSPLDHTVPQLLGLIHRLAPVATLRVAAPANLHELVGGAPCPPPTRQEGSALRMRDNRTV